MMSLRSLLAKMKESKLAGLAYVLFQRLRQASLTKRAVFFPDQLYTGTAGDLRAVAIAYELRKLGWRTVVVPPWLDLRVRRWILGLEPGAIVFLQQSRHPLNRPSLYPSNKSIFDADDADILQNPEPVLECLRDSAAVIAGSDFLAQKFRPHNDRVTVIWTGTYVERAKAFLTAPRSSTIVWAQSNPFDYPQEASMMLTLWLRLAELGKEFKVVVYSQEPDRVADWLKPLTKMGVTHHVRPRMRYREFVASLTGSAIGLQPICTSYGFSQGKSFGKVLAYIAAGVPVIASNEVDHGRFFRNGENGLLVRTMEDWIAACTHLLSDPDAALRYAAEAYQDLSRQLSTRSAAVKVERVLSSVQALSTLPIGSGNRGARKASD